MNIRKSKKAIMHTWFDYTISIVGGIVIFVVIFFAMGTATARVEREIKSQAFDIRSEETLVNYLSGYVSKGSPYEALLSKDAYKLAETLSESKTTFADLIVTAENDEVLKEILEKETKYVLDNTLGENKWKLDIKSASGNVISQGEVEGETKVYNVKIPATGYQIINIKLTMEK